MVSQEICGKQVMIWLRYEKISTNIANCPAANGDSGMKNRFMYKRLIENLLRLELILQLKKFENPWGMSHQEVFKRLTTGVIGNKITRGKTNHNIPICMYYRRQAAGGNPQHAKSQGADIISGYGCRLCFSPSPETGKYIIT